MIFGSETYPMEALDYWDEVERLPHVIGDFVWTALDYLGEAGIGRFWYKERGGWLGAYPWHTAFCGDIDLCGFKRPQSYYRDCVWGVSKAPYIAVHRPAHYGEEPGRMMWSWPDVVSSWDWPGFAGRPAAVDVYCADDEAELFLNGRSLGRRPCGKENRYTASFDTVYEPGELIAVGYKDGAEHTRTVLRTAGAPAAIRLTPDRTALAGAGDLAYVTVEVVDAAGNVVHTAQPQLFFTVCGSGSLLAVGSSDPLSEEPYVGNTRRAYEGRAMAVVRADEEGKITLNAAADGLPAVSILLTSGAR